MDHSLTSAMYRAINQAMGEDEVFASTPKHHGVPKLFLHEAEWDRFESEGFDMGYFERVNPKLNNGRS